MAFEDLHGLAISTPSDTAAHAYRRGIELMLSAWPGGSEALELAIEADPDFALAYAARSRMHLIYGEMPSAQEKAAVARKLVERNGTAREKGHVEILALTTEGQSARALEMTLGHLESWPRDALILALPLGAFGLFAFSGMADHDQARVDLCERHARHYDDDWWFLTYLGWSHTENGSVDAGRGITERAFDIRRENARALDALAHAMFEDGSTDDAGALISGWLPIYDRSGLMYGHVAWHEALLALEQGDTGKAGPIYFERIQPSVTRAAPLNAMTDGVSLLWRLQASGHPVPDDAWRDLADYAERRFARAGNSFIDVHMAMLAAMTGNWTALEARSRSRHRARERQAAGRLRRAGHLSCGAGFRRAGFSGLCEDTGAGCRRGGADWRQPRATRNARRKASDRADEEGRSRQGARTAGSPPASPSVIARCALANRRRSRSVASILRDATRS